MMHQNAAIPPACPLSRRLLPAEASVRSEAFGSGLDHPHIQLAMGLVLPLLYSPDELEAMLNDRIRRVDPAQLLLPLHETAKPIHALCGFDKVTHEDRNALDGGRYTEDVFESILRHTRLVPREVIGMGGAIYGITGKRSYLTVKNAVNAQASSDVAWAITHSFLGWNDALHRRFAVSLPGEAIAGKDIGALAARFEQDGPRIIKFFVQHGLLGTSDPLPQRHRHYYQQRFAFDELHGNHESSSVSNDYFFTHPAFKQWILSLDEKLNMPFKRLERGVIGNLKPFEAQSPLLRAGVARGQVTLELGPTGRSVGTPDVENECGN